jgi:hypothetical protein
MKSCGSTTIWLYMPLGSTCKWNAWLDLLSTAVFPGFIALSSAFLVSNGYSYMSFWSGPV